MEALFYKSNPWWEEPFVFNAIQRDIYLNELDQFVSRELKQKHYVRYMDDFLILGSKKCLNDLKIRIEQFLIDKLHFKALIFGNGVEYIYVIANNQAIFITKFIGRKAGLGGHQISW